MIPYSVSDSLMAGLFLFYRSVLFTLTVYPISADPGVRQHPAIGSHIILIDPSSGLQHTVFVKIIPVIINLSPSGNAVTILIKIIPFIINLFPLPRRPDSIILLIPPAVFFLLPGACQNSVRYLYIYRCKAQQYSGKIFVSLFFNSLRPFFIVTVHSVLSNTLRDALNLC